MSGQTQAILLGCGLLLLFSVFFIRAFGDVLIRLAGADHVELRKWNVDRGYFLGLGLALILSSGVSTLALMIASSVAFGLSLFSTPSLLLGGLYFFLIFSLDRWLVSDQTAGFATEQGGKFGVGAAWFRNFVAELVKILPRAAVVYFASALFADFMLLVVFSSEIQEQTKITQIQAETQFTEQVKGEVAKRTKDAEDRLKTAGDEKAQLQKDFNDGIAVVQQAAQQRSTELARLEAAGIRCRNVAISGWYRNSAGRSVYGVVRYERQCPVEVQNVEKAYDAQVGRFPKSQTDVDKAKADVDTKYKVVEATTYVSGGAEAEVRKEWKDRAPSLKDGLLIRMRSLELLTSKPDGACDPSIGPQSSFSEACVSRYSERAEGLQRNLRLWILLLEMTPVMIKFVTSILPRRGYASVMAARDEEAKIEALISTGKLRGRVRVEVERAVREERLRMELETSGVEVELRHLEGERLRANSRRIREAHRSRAEQPTVILSPVGKSGASRMDGVKRKARQAMASMRAKLAWGKRAVIYLKSVRVSQIRQQAELANQSTLEIPMAKPPEVLPDGKRDESAPAPQRVIDSESHL